MPSVKKHIPGPCLRLCDGKDQMGNDCDSSPDVCGKYRSLRRTGVSMIAEERSRQVHVEGYTPEHDAQHTTGMLAQVAACYCLVYPGPAGVVNLWPDSWGVEAFKREGSPLPSVRDLQKAGAFIAAEIDRRLAAGDEDGKAAVSRPASTPHLESGPGVAHSCPHCRQVVWVFPVRRGGRVDGCYLQATEAMEHMLDAAESPAKAVQP